MDYLLMRIRQGLLTVPPETDIVLFLQHDGKPPEPTSPGCQRIPVRRGDAHPGRPAGPLSQDARKRQPGTDDDRRHPNAFPAAGLTYPKFHEKPPFQTYEEVQRRIAAYTGARRAEMLRALVSDVDFDAQTLHEWIHHGKHPGGQHLFSQRVHVIRSKTKRTAPTPITEDEAHDHFKRTFRDTKWKVVRGYHVFRHSFISLCASRGIDQRLIDEWTGHCTEEQRKRYRHLFPTTQRAAIASVFGQ